MSKKKKTKPKPHVTTGTATLKTNQPKEQTVKLQYFTEPPAKTKQRELMLKDCAELIRDIDVYFTDPEKWPLGESERAKFILWLAVRVRHQVGFLDAHE